MSVEFQRRRHHTWKTVRWWLLLTVLAMGAFALGPQGNTLALSRNQFTYQLVCMVIAFVALFIVIRGVSTHYRCPSCNAMPMRRMGGGGGGGFTFSYRKGVDLNPSECPKCGAILRSD